MPGFNDFVSANVKKKNDTQAQFGAATATEGQNAGEDRNRYVDLLQNGQQAFETSAKAAVDAAMPAFNHQIQGIREQGNRRGITTGDLGTTYEGDAASAFQKNITNSIAGQAESNYQTRLGASGSLYGQESNNYLDMLSGQLDRDTAARNADRARKASLWGAGISAVGNIASAAIGKFGK